MPFISLIFMVVTLLVDVTLSNIFVEVQAYEMKQTKLNKKLNKNELKTTATNLKQQQPQTNKIKQNKISRSKQPDT